MPTPEESPIILISCCFSHNYLDKKTIVLIGKSNPFKNDILNNENTLKVDIKNKIEKMDDIKWFSSESDMIYYFYDIIKNYDPDIITGYNIKEFDIPYLLKRIEILNLKNTFISRDKTNGHIGKYGFQTKIEFCGRLIIDVFPLVKRDFNLKQYTLKNVAKELLNKEKLDVDPKDMEIFWNSNNEKLLKFIDYSRRDSELVILLLFELRLLDKYIALSQITNSITQDIVDGGQTLMVEQIMLREYLNNERVMPSKPNENIIINRELESKSLKGGAVLEPIKGLHENVIILDFKSLYPTIMMAYNLCYTTVIEKSINIKDLGLSNNDIIITSSGSSFIKKEIYKGIIPSILENLLLKRTFIKSQIRKSVNKEEIHSLNAIQMAIKILLNSYYGYSGYSRARLYSIEVANSVTSIGRQNIENTKNIILNNKFNQNYNNNSPKLEVIYGDTDSIFVKCQFPKKCLDNNKLINELFTSDLDNKELDELFEIGNIISKFVTQNLPHPMELEFESISKRVLLIAKKRYAHWTFERESKAWNNKIKVKGMETIRRDWCSLTSSSLSHVLELILINGNIEEAINYVHKKIYELKTLNLKKNNEYIEQLILTKNYSKYIESYKNKQPHVTVVDKIKYRTGQSVSLGTRIPYVIISGKGLLVERAEDPKYVLENNLSIDVEYYLNKQLLPPIERIFESIGFFNIFDKTTDIHQRKLIDSLSSNFKLVNKNTIPLNNENKINNDKKQQQKSIFDF